MTWQTSVKKGNELVVVTSSNKSDPHAIVVISLGIHDKKLLIGACQMKTTLNNLLKNKKIVVVTKYKKEYYRLKGTVELLTSGKHHEYAIKNSKPYTPSHTIAINIKEVWDLDKIKKIL
jgi:hypothetical protein